MRAFSEKRFSLGETAALLALALGANGAVQAAVTLPYTFTAGTAAKASEVNANFAALKAAIDAIEVEMGNHAVGIDEVEDASYVFSADIASLQAQTAYLESAVSPLASLAPFVSVSQDALNGLAGPHILFTGANVHVRNGGGGTVDDEPNGLGNLILGYDENGAAYERSGQHNLIVGANHGFTGSGGSSPATATASPERGPR